VKAGRARPAPWKLDALLYCLLLPLIVFASALAVIAWLTASPMQLASLFQRPDRWLFYAFALGYLSSMGVALLSVPLGALRLRLNRREQLPDPRLQTHSIIASSDAFESENVHVRTTYKWSAFSGVTRHDEAFVLWQADELRFYLPFRTFATPADVDRFFELAKAGIASPARPAQA
jgi:YcxB-like protein